MHQLSWLRGEIKDGDVDGGIAAYIQKSVETLNNFKRCLKSWDDCSGQVGARDYRNYQRLLVNQNRRRVEAILEATGCMTRISLTPPPRVNGVAIPDANPFDHMFGTYHWQSMTPHINDMIDSAVGVLKDPCFADHLKQLWVDSAPLSDASGNVARVIRICRRFPVVATELQTRHAGRGSHVIDDEYDVQDLLRALLRIDFEDVRPEEWTPSYAGKSARLDFLLKREKIVVEVKKTRPC